MFILFSDAIFGTSWVECIPEENFAGAEWGVLTTKAGDIPEIYPRCHDLTYSTPDT